MAGTFQLSEKNKKLLREILLRGMDGSYYDRGDMPGGDDISAFLEKTLDEISMERAAEIGKFYGLTGQDLVEIIDDEEECMEWLGRRALPWDDPW